MDKNTETAVELERIRGILAQHTIEIEHTKEEIKSWKKFGLVTIWETTRKIFTMSIIGIVLGWHLPEGLRRWLIDLITK